MIMQMKVHLIVVFLFTIAGCHRQSYNIFNGEFRYVEYSGKIEMLTGEEVDIDGLGIRRTWIADTLLLVWSPYNEESFASIYSLNSNKLLYNNLLLIGRGPNEYLYVEIAHLYTDSSGVKAWFSVNYREKLILVDISSTILQQRLVVEREIELNVEERGAIHAAFFDRDTSIVLQKIFHNDHLSIYNPVSGESRFIGWLYSDEYPNYLDIEVFSVYYVYNMEKSVLAGGMVYFNQINFYPLKIGVPYSISTVRRAIRYDNIKSMPTSDRLNYYGPISYDEDVIILTSYGSGKKDDEHCNAVENIFLHVVTWEGALLKIFKLDCCFVGHSFDSRTGYLYGVDIETDRILRYKINL